MNFGKVGFDFFFKENNTNLLTVFLTFFIFAPWSTCMQGDLGIGNYNTNLAGLQHHSGEALALDGMLLL